MLFARVDTDPGPLLDSAAFAELRVTRSDFGSADLLEPGE